ncbi:MAG: UDP-galactopyranose mutase [Actinomycetota bacterium]|nr:UDP-galactopyranose mutase [Actinomycetota bacterium]
MSRSDGYRSRGERLDFDVLCFSHLRWDFVWQRPQHLLSRCARECRVFFVEEPVHDGGPRLELRPGEDNLTVVVPHLPADIDPEAAVELQRELLATLVRRRSIEDVVAWYYTPMALPFTRELEPVAVVYDCMDELSAFALAPREIRSLERELLERADLVFTGGRSLYEAKRELHRDVHLFPSSVDTVHFARARDPQDDPADQAGLARPRLGFFGVIDERMDLDLLGGIADARPDWQLVMLGPVVKIDEASLPRRPNVHYLGPKRYEDLPAYLAGWDVALLPFVRNESTRFISPTKTPEYLAAGMPVVSTSIPDVVDPYGEEGLVRIADDPEAFVAAAEEAMAEPAAQRRRIADGFLNESSWDYTWADMRELVHDAAARRRGDVSEGGAVRRVRVPKRFDWLVVGAGFAGSVVAERLASQLGARVLVVDRRRHIAGNAFDHYDDAGVLVHRYGPHIFHTNSKDVFDYLSRFTQWRPYEHRVLAQVDGQLVPFPINLDTVNQLYGLSLNALELDEFFASLAEPRNPVRTAEDLVVSKVGRELYTKFFRNYTRKQWDLDPSELDASVAARVPTRSSRDDRYFTDTYQAMPLHGYTRMFERMLAHPNIKVLLGADWREVDGLFGHDRLVYTGPIDEYFDFRYGPLPYRSLEFRFETVDTPVFQPAPVVNYPNEHEYTRVTEFKYLTGQEHPKTTVVYEYPRAEGDPYYPVPRPENAEIYKEYKRLADAETDTVFVGRLATYKYYNMDQVVAQALAAFGRILSAEPDPEDADAPLTRSVSSARGVGGGRVHGQPRSRRVRRPD